MIIFNLSISSWVIPSPGTKPRVSHTVDAKFGSGIEITSDEGRKGVISMENECDAKFPCTSITRRITVSPPASANSLVINSTVELSPLSPLQAITPDL